MRLRRLKPGDWITAGLVVVFTVPTSISLLASAAPWVVALGGACIAVLTALLFVRRALPRVSFLICCGTLLVLLALPDLPDGVPMILLPISLCHLPVLHAVVAETGRWRLPLVVTMIGLGLILLRATSAVPDPLSWGAFWALVPLAATVVLSTVALGVRDWENRQAQEQRLIDAVNRERTLMAQEVHDVVAHSVAVMVAQADAALLVGERDPARARELLENAVRTGRDAMTEMRSAVRLLRDGEPPETAPVTSLRDLDRLIPAIRTPQLEVELAVAGDAERVTTETARAAYRIVQESLTNAAKHGTVPVRCEVRVEVDEREVRLRIRDNGPGIRADAAASLGLGIAGMRERARTVGGRLDIAADRSGTQVRAWLPIA
ncbi:sensor histidine kinase [Occultella aeris]|uniref:histidine kinase n=1 Tax=Occultella aeris TaxID=2761496 RepID=A0A7M4DRC7_9MICO|nr:sensor histidine kinase [Occultella aeris]VZO40021.1 Sensor histidine kinase LiaS [Occultella aeris]